MPTLPKVHGTLIPAPQAANYTHKGGVHTCPSIPKNAVTTVTLEDLFKEPNTNPFATQYRLKCIHTNAGPSVIQCVPNNPASSKLGLHTCSSIKLHNSGELHMVKKGWLPFFASLHFLYNV